LKKGETGETKICLGRLQVKFLPNRDCSIGGNLPATISRLDEVEPTAAFDHGSQGRYGASCGTIWGRTARSQEAALSEELLPYIAYRVGTIASLVVVAVSPESIVVVARGVVL